MACSKRQYKTREAAIQALATIKQRREDGTFDDYCWATRGYLHEPCGAWHLTKTDLPNRKPIDSDVLPGDYCGEPE